MSESSESRIGTIGWVDLTIENAEGLKDFYRAVVGWEPSPVSMGDYSDFNMKAPGTGNPVARVCHRRGSNEDIPPQWMIYVYVDDLDQSIRRCEELGGRIVAGPKGPPDGDRYCFIEDPAGAVLALYQQA